MAEFCLDCLNKYINSSKPLKEKDVILIDDWCEQCQKRKPCVVVIKPKTFRGRMERKYNIIKYNLHCFIKDLTKKCAKKSRH